MKLNQPYYLNVILLEIFFWVRKAWEAFLLSVQIALFQDRSNFKSDWSRLCTFLMISLSLGQGLSEFTNWKFSSYAKREHQRDTTIIPFGSLIIFLILGCLATKKIHFFHLDSKWIFLIKKKNGLLLLIHSFLIYSIGWVWPKTHLFLSGFKKRPRSSLVWTPSVLRKKKVWNWMWKGASKEVQKNW